MSSEQQAGTVLITGGTSGIGAACVRVMAADGYRVVFTGRDAQAGAALGQAASGSVFVGGDVSEPADCERIVNLATEIGGGRLSGLVNNAGMPARQAFADATVADWDRVFSVNARSAFLFTRLALEALAAAGGSVVMMSSIAGKVGEEGLSLYTASKAALLGLTQSLALEIGSQVRVNAVCPGQIETRMMSRTLSQPGRREALEARIPVGRLGTADDVAEVVRWLISPASSFVNGAIITVDGGETAGLRNLPTARSKP